MGKTPGEENGILNMKEGTIKSPGVEKRVCLKKGGYIQIWGLS